MTDIAVVALVQGGRVLLVHRHPGRENYPDCWDLPGGHVEEGEPPAVAAVRECREELGVELSNVIPVATYEMHSGLRKHVFVATQWLGTPDNCAPDEHDAMSWFTLEQAKALDMADPDCLPNVFAALDGSGRL
ncbi:NUDIX hydrolase [Luteococcus sp. OSA5]|uniref:NUDIX hydrolase n=1 Tax=Luteococcus sp. OSA5 TaxID=3401630 RepID=UPI003B42FF3A